jgi:hypothetical protein
MIRSIAQYCVICLFIYIIIKIISCCGGQRISFKVLRDTHIHVIPEENNHCNLIVVFDKSIQENIYNARKYSNLSFYGAEVIIVDPKELLDNQHFRLRLHKDIHHRQCLLLFASGSSFDLFAKDSEFLRLLNISNVIAAVNEITEFDTKALDRLRVPVYLYNIGKPESQVFRYGWGELLLPKLIVQKVSPGTFPVLSNDFEKSFLRRRLFYILGSLFLTAISIAVYMFSIINNLRRITVFSFIPALNTSLFCLMYLIFNFGRHDSVMSKLFVPFLIPDNQTIYNDYSKTYFNENYTISNLYDFAKTPELIVTKMEHYHPVLTPLFRNWYADLPVDAANSKQTAVSILQHLRLRIFIVPIPSEKDRLIDSLNNGFADESTFNEIFRYALHSINCHLDSNDALSECSKHDPSMLIKIRESKGD